MKQLLRSRQDSNLRRCNPQRLSKPPLSASQPLLLERKSDYSKTIVLPTQRFPSVLRDLSDSTSLCDKQSNEMPWGNSACRRGQWLHVRDPWPSQDATADPRSSVVGLAGAGAAVLLLETRLLVRTGLYVRRVDLPARTCPTSGGWLIVVSHAEDEGIEPPRVLPHHGFQDR